MAEKHIAKIIEDPRRLEVETEKIGNSIFIKIFLLELDSNYAHSKRTASVRFTVEDETNTIQKVKEYQDCGYISEKVETYGPLTFASYDFPLLDKQSFEESTYLVEVIVSNEGQPAIGALEEFDRFTITFQKIYKYSESNLTQSAATKKDVLATITTEEYISTGKKLYPPALEGVIPAGHDLSSIAVPFIMNKTVGWPEVDGIQLIVKNINNNQQIATTRAYKIDKDNYIAYFNLNQFESNFIRGQNYKFQIAYVGKVGEVI